MKTLFFGTPKLAVPFLEELINTYEVSGVITRPDCRAKRGQHLLAPPIKECALANSIPVIQPEKFTPEHINNLKKYNVDAGVVVSYGRLIPRDVFTIPKYGCFNIHFSLLPNYRGAAPVQRALINGDVKTGVTSFWIEETLDSGNIIVQKEIAIDPFDDTVTLFSKLIPLGINVMNETMLCLAKGKLSGLPQKGTPTFAPVLKKQEGRIDWNNSAKAIYNLIRGTMGWPGAHALLKHANGSLVRFKILKAAVCSDGYDKSVEPGKICKIEKGSGFAVRCAQASILIEQLHCENKKPVSAWQFLQGCHESAGEIVFL